MRIGGRGMQVVNDMPFNDILKITQMAVSHFEDCGLKRLGGGQYGDVYLYIDKHDKKYAIKVWHKSRTNQDSDIERLLQLQDSEYFPKLYMYKKRSFVVMEFFEGRTLAELYDKTAKEYADSVGKPTIKYIVDGNKTIEKAFRFAMSRGVLPNDTHGQNIMVTPDGQLRFIDVGFFKDYKIKYRRWKSWRGTMCYDNNKTTIEDIKKDINNYAEFGYAKGAYRKAFDALVEERAKKLQVT